MNLSAFVSVLRRIVSSLTISVLGALASALIKQPAILHKALERSSDPLVETFLYQTDKTKIQQVERKRAPKAK